MEFTLHNILALVLYIDCFAGITVNLIIVAANIKKCKTLKSFPTSDKILNCLVISRSLAIFNVLLAYLFSQLYPWMIVNAVLTAILLTIGMILHYTEFWFATVLCVFYCVKITTYNWKFFNFMKTRISTLVQWFLLASLIISISSSLPLGFYISGLNPQNVSNSSNETATVYKEKTVRNLSKMLIIVLVGSSPPFLIFLVADYLLLHSLCKHTRRMKRSGSWVRCPNLEFHFSAVKNMSVFLVLQMIGFVFMNVLYSGILYDYKVLRIVTLIITCSLPSFHSFYMICACNEIKKALISLCHSLTRCK